MSCRTDPAARLRRWRRRRSSAAFAATVAMALALLAGCGGPGTSAERRADEIADAALLHIQSYKGRLLDETVAAVGGDGVVMAISGDVVQGGVTLVLRVEAWGTDQDVLEQRESHVVRCYELFVHKRADTWIAEKRIVDCPAGEPVAMEPPPRMPVGAVDGLEATLAALATSTPSADEVRAAVAAAIPGREVEVEVVQDGETTGVAVQVRLECVLGRIVGGRVEAWNPPDAVVQPGELGCTAAVAAAGGAEHPPH